MTELGEYWREPERLSDYALLVEEVATGFCRRLQSQVRGGTLSVREAARLLGWSSPSKVGRLVTMETAEIKVPIRWSGVRPASRTPELPGQTSIEDR